MSKTVILTDVVSKRFIFSQLRDGTWVIHFDYAVVDAQGASHGSGELDFTPGANAQTQINNLAAQALAAARNKEGL